MAAKDHCNVTVYATYADHRKHKYVLANDEDLLQHNKNNTTNIR